MLRDGDGTGTVFPGSVSTVKDCWYECSACEKTWCSSDSPYREYEKYCCLYSDGTTECKETGDACANCC